MSSCVREVILLTFHMARGDQYCTDEGFYQDFFFFFFRQGSVTTTKLQSTWPVRNVTVSWDSCLKRISQIKPEKRKKKTLHTNRSFHHVL